MKFKQKAWALSAIAVACLQAHAYEVKLENGVEVKVNSTVTLGTQIRASDPSPDAYSAAVSPYVPGVPPGKLAGQNGGPNLNFAKGDQISTVLKGVVDVDVKRGNIGLFVRAAAWKDFVLGEKSMRYGNYANGFTPNTPLADTGFALSSEFNNAELRDAYVYGSTTLDGGKTLSGRLGRQVLNWGGSQLFAGGVGSTTNPADFSSQLRPGAQPVDARLPLGMLSARLAAGAAWSLEGFAAYEHRGNVYPGCGTYFDVASFLPQGCDMISFAGASERTRLSTGTYVHRSPDVSPSPKHFGLAAGFKSDALGADVKLYAMNTTVFAPVYRMTVKTTTAGDPNNTDYGLIYPDSIQVFGASFSKKLNEQVTTFGELAYRHGQPLSFNASDLLGAFVNRSPTSLLALRKGLTTFNVGDTYDAYDRFGIVTGSVGATRVFAKALGADRVSVTGELGFSHINSLPSPDMIRFGRGTAYGAATYVGATSACTEQTGGKTCTTDGYITSNAWGLRIVASATYPNLVAGATVTPSLAVFKDVRGYSYDGTFSQGRTVIRPGVRADWNQKYFADLQYSRFSGGRYNLLVDRSYWSLVGGLRF